MCHLQQLCCHCHTLHVSMQHTIPAILGSRNCMAASSLFTTAQASDSTIAVRCQLPVSPYGSRLQPGRNCCCSAVTRARRLIHAWHQLVCHAHGRLEWGISRGNTRHATSQTTCRAVSGNAPFAAFVPLRCPLPLCSCQDMWNFTLAAVFVLQSLLLRVGGHALPAVWDATGPKPRGSNAGG